MAGGQGLGVLVWCGGDELGRGKGQALCAQGTGPCGWGARRLAAQLASEVWSAPRSAPVLVRVKAPADCKRLHIGVVIGQVYV